MLISLSRVHSIWDAKFWELPVPRFLTLSWLETSVHSVTPFFKHCLHLASMTLSLLYPSFPLTGFSGSLPSRPSMSNVPALQPVFSTSPHLSVLIHLQDFLNMRFSLDLSPDLDLIPNLLLLIKHLWWDCLRHTLGSSLHKRFLPTGFPILENGNSNSDCSYPQLWRFRSSFFHIKHLGCPRMVELL